MDHDLFDYDSLCFPIAKNIFVALAIGITLGLVFAACMWGQ